MSCKAMISMKCSNTSNTKKPISWTRPHSDGKQGSQKGTISRRKPVCLLEHYERGFSSYTYLTEEQP